MKKIDLAKVGELAKVLGLASVDVLLELEPLDLTDIDSANTIADIKEVFADLDDDTELQYLALEKWLSLCTTISELDDLNNHTVEGGKIERLVLEKREELSKQEVANAVTFNKAMEAYQNTLEGSESESLAQVKLLSLCTTVGQINDLLSVSDPYTEFRDDILKKGLSFCVDIDDLAELVDDLAEGSALRRSAIRQMYDLDKL